MLLFLTVALIFHTINGDSEGPKKIINGNPTSIRKFPYQVSVRYYGMLICGGSVLNEKVVVTAAHCIYPNKKHVSIQAGSSYFRLNIGQSSAVEQTITHPKYNNELIDYDIALLILQTPLRFNENVHPIQLTKREPKVGEYAIATGWGNTRSDGGRSEILRYVKVPIISRDVCNLLLEDSVTDRMLCAGYITGGYDTCQGDSGGPLAINNELVGITSWGYDCAQPGAPGVYTNVASLAEWVESTLTSLKL